MATSLKACVFIDLGPIGTAVNYRAGSIGNDERNGANAIRTS
jgi:hypothetical protein